MKFALPAILALILFHHSPAKALDIGEVAPCVVLGGLDSDGNPTRGCIRDRENASQSFTLLEFFSVFCSDCVANLPKVTALSHDIAEQTTVRLVGTDRDAEATKQFIADNNVQEAVAFDTSRQAMRAYDILSTPTLFLLDQNNVVVFKHEGVLEQADIDEIKTLVGAQNPNEGN